MMTIDEVENSSEYRLHHMATHQGYVSRKTQGTISYYNGRFGEGYKVCYPRWDTSYYMWVAYYIRVPQRGEEAEE